MDTTTIYHQPTDIYFQVESLDEYMKEMKGDFLSLDIFNGIFIDNEEQNGQEKIINPPWYD